MSDPSIPSNRVYWHTGGYAPNRLTNADGVAYWQNAGHCEFRVLTNPSFSGSFTIQGNPLNADVDSSSVAVYVDGVFSQTVAFNVGANLNKLQSIVVNTGLPGVRTIRIQEGDRYAGVCLTQITIDGTVLPAPAIQRKYVLFSDSIGQGCLATPRTLGWAERMRDDPRFDSVVILGKSAYSLLDALFPGYDAAAATVLAKQMLPPVAAHTGAIENVVSMCMVINDWFNSFTTAATFGVWLALVADAIKATADAQGTPGFKLFLHSATHVLTAISGANPGGSTVAQFNAQVAAVAAARPSFCTFVDLSNSHLDADMVDGVHPNAVGHGKIFAAVRAVLGDVEEEAPEETGVGPGLSSTLTYDQDPWHRPGLDELGGASQQLATIPRDPRTVPHVKTFQQLVRQIVSQATLAPSVRLQVEFPSGVPTITQLIALNTEIVAGDFTITDNGNGDTSLTLTNYVGEQLSPLELTVVEDVEIDRERVFAIANGWRVKTKLGATGTNAAFVLALHAPAQH